MFAALCVVPTVGGKVMEIVEHSKCQKCAKVLNLSELKNNPDGVGFVCIDSDACKEQQRVSLNKRHQSPIGF
jgi:hypothetical protein